jgi:hypothetical protein
MIAGTLSDQGDLQTALNLKASITYVDSAIAVLNGSKANLSGATFTGAISAPNLSGINTGDQDLSGLATTTALTSGLAAKEPTIAAGTTAQYWRGDKSWQALNKTAVGLANVDNTAETAKPVSTAQQTALNLKANLSGAVFTGAISATNLSGTNTGDQTITLTGDVTGAGTGSFATTIGANKVTLAKMAQVATGTFLGRTTAATGNVEVMTAAQAKTLLALTKNDVGLANVDNTSDVNKPVSTAQQTALNGKLSLTGGTLSGNLTVGGGTLFVTSSLLVQHDGSSGFVRSQVGPLSLGAGGSTTVVLDAAGGMQVLGGVAAGGSITQGGVNVSLVGHTHTSSQITDLPALASGVYTPTISSTSNITSATAAQAQYMRVGDVVTVSGYLTIDPVAANTSTSLEISLPIASNLGGPQDLAGVANNGFWGEAGSFQANATTDKALFFARPTDAGSGAWFFTFTYRII